MRYFIGMLLVYYVFIPHSVFAEGTAMGGYCTLNLECGQNLECEDSDIDQYSDDFCVCNNAAACAEAYGGDAKEWVCTDGSNEIHALHYCQKVVNGEKKDPLALSTDPTIKKLDQSTQKNSSSAVTELNVDTLLGDTKLILNKPVPKISIPGVDFSEVKQINGSDGNIYLEVPFLGEYISSIYKYIVIVAGIVATIVLIFAGVQWMFPSPDSQKQAMSRIQKAVIGLTLIITSYSILYTLNPELVQFRNLRVLYIKQDLIAAGAPLSEYNSYQKNNPEISQEFKTIATNITGSADTIKLITAYENLLGIAGGDQKSLSSSWKGQCLQFAHALAQKAQAPNIKNSNQIYSYLPIVKNTDGSNAFAGMTLEELGNQSQLQPGMIIHIKVNYDNPKSYEPAQNFHHWYTYMGKDKNNKGVFADSFKPNWNGKAADNFMKGWVKKHINDPKYRIPKEWFDAHPNRPLQPTVTAVHLAF